MTDDYHRLWGRDGRIPAWFRRHVIVADIFLAVAMLFVSALLWQLSTLTDALPPLTALGWIWITVGVIPIAVRRIRLWWAVVGAIAVLAASTLDPFAGFGIGFSNIIITYTIAAYRPLRRALELTGVLAAAITATVFIPTELAMNNLDLAVSLLLNYMLLTISFGIGRAVHNRRKNLLQLRDRARLAEENQVALAEQAVADERRRIARELHDVVAHHISVMGVMATGARRMLTKDPAKADEALATIETTGRATLREMRRLLDVLRSTEETDDELTPQPGLDAVHALVAQVRDAGLKVNLVIDGEPYPLDPGIALTVYRIVQESLTNTLKHAGPARAGLRIQYGTEALEIEVADTGLGPRTRPVDTGRIGHGLVGMRERVALYGGSLRTGPRPGGGFRIHAVIPIDNPATPVGADNGGTS